MNSSLNYQLQKNVTLFVGLGNTAPKLNVTNSNITVSCGTSGNISEITGLIAQSGELELANDNILFYIEKPVDKFIGLVGEQQGEASIVGIALLGNITANTSAFGLFQTTQGVVQLQNS